MEPDAATPRPEKRTSAGESTLSPALRKFQKQGAMVARLSTLQSASAAAMPMGDVATTSTSRDLERKMAMRDSAQLENVRRSSITGYLEPVSLAARRQSRRRSTAARRRSTVADAAKAAVGALDGRMVWSNRKWYIIMPFSLRKQLWDVVVFVTLLVEVVTLPMVAAFSPALQLWALAAVDVVFGLDFVLSFFTAYVTTDTNKVIKELPLIARHYARTYLVFDAVALVGTYALLVPVGKAAILCRLLRLRFLQTFLGSHNLPITSKFFAYYDVTTKLLYFLVLAHLACCLFFVVVLADGDGDAAVAADADVSAQYVDALYITLALFLGDTELGYRAGEQSGHLLFAVGLLLIGALICAYLFAMLQLANSNLSRLRFQERMKVVNEKMHFYRLPDALQSRVRSRYDGSSTVSSIVTSSSTSSVRRSSATSASTCTQICYAPSRCSAAATRTSSPRSPSACDLSSSLSKTSSSANRPSAARCTSSSAAW